MMGFTTREMSNKLYASAFVSGPNVIRVMNDARATMLASSTFDTKIKYKSNYTVVKLAIDHAATTVPTSSYVYKIAYKIEGCPSTRDSIYSYSSFDTLVVAYNPDSLSAYQDVQIKVYPKLYQAKLTINQVFDITSGTPVALSVPLTNKNFFVELSMQYQPFLKTHYAPSDMLLNTTSSYNAATQQLAVNWTPATAPYLGVVSPANYELEWTYVDDYAKDGTALAASNLDYAFKNNATRIITDTLAYNIPVVYPKGYIIYRVRMLRVDSNLYKHPIYGVWSLASSTGKVNSVPSASRYQITTPHSGDSLNWNYTIHFAEKGKYKHVIGYFDGMLKNRQTLTRFNSQSNLLLATENIYDYEGRPSITTLPSVINSNRFGFQKGVSISSVTGLPYAPIDFDVKPSLCPDEILIPSFTESSLANKYYSRLNTDTAGVQKFVPQAEGYPFVHTQLSPGFSDRVDRQSGAGADLQISKGHEIKNEYLEADQPDLNNLFGINAGFSNFYNKTVSKDPNGQYSMSVKDYEGKQVVSSLIGASVDTSRHAIMFNDEIPLAGQFREDKLARGTSNRTILPNMKVYSGSFYMDFASAVNIKYEYDFQPFTVCSSPYLGLTVKGSYDYTVHDDCGVEKLHKNGIIGTTGVTTTPTIPPAVSSDMVSLEKGKHTVNKNLTISVDEIYAAVDSFMAYKPNCLKTENEFIKEEVEHTPYPCPGYDPCEALAKSMMEELFTDAKYGGRINGLRIGHYPVFPFDAPSIYERQTIPYLSSELYRYQAPCVAWALDTLVIKNEYGTFTNISKCRVDSFINYIYIGPAKYAIARILLPLHPEYCKLQGCFIDTFETRFKAIPNAAIAQKYNLFSLDSIVKKDVFLRNKMYGAPFMKTFIDDSLKLMYGGLVRIDTMCAEYAFCTNNESLVYGDAKGVFHNDIINLNFPTNSIRNNYFEKLQTLYLSNRDKYVSMALSASDTNCGPCDTFRMKLKPPPVIPVMYNPDGSLATGPDSYLASLSDSMRAKVIAMAGAPSTYTSTDTMAKYRDSAARVIARADSLLNYIAVDSILSRTVNCFGSMAIKARFKDSLVALIKRKEVTNGQFMPHQVRSALSSSGIALNDLCHPYLISYDYYKEGLAPGFSCGVPSLFAAAKDFFNDPAINTVLRSTGTGAALYTPAWPSSNAFATKIAASISGGGGSIKMQTQFINSDSTYKLAFYRTGSADTLVLNVATPTRIKVGATRHPYFYLPGAGSLIFENAFCYFDDPQALAEGYINRFIFRATVRRNDVIAVGDTLKSKAGMSIWNNGKMIINEDVSNEIAMCIPCTQFRTVYQSFADSMSAFGGYAVDHPLFFKSMRSFMNFTLKRIYTEMQYEKFFTSCALADSMAIPQYGGYGKLNFPSTTYSTFDDFAAAISLSDDIADLQYYIDYRTTSPAKQYTIIDYRSVPYDKLKIFNTKLLAQGGTLKTPATGVIGQLWLPDGTVTSSVLAGTAFSLSAATSVSVRKSPYLPDTDPYTRYNVTAGTLTNAQKSEAIFQVQYNMDQLGVQGYWQPNNFATVNEEYFLPHKKSFLNYVYALQYFPKSKVLDSLQTPFLKSNISLFAGNELSYQDPNNPYHFSDLYITDSSSRFPQYDTVIRMLNYAKATLGGNKIFLPTNKAMIDMTVGLPAGHSMKLYRCGDGLYWYRYFGKGLQLFDVYLRVPVYFYQNQHPDLELIGIRPSIGDTASKRFIAALKIAGTTDTLYASGSTDFNIAWSGKLNDVLLGNEADYKIRTPESGEPGSEPNCEQNLLANDIYQGKVKYENYIAKFYANLRKTFKAYMLSQVREKLWVEYVDMRFGTTLYTYDRANNLIQTVPPAGVQKVDTATVKMVDSLREHDIVIADAIPKHTKATNYEYNSINKPLLEKSPDAGIKLMFYDAKGNVLLSQSEKQRRSQLYTYFLYDAQNRLNETGEVKWGNCAYFEPIKMYQYNGPILYYMPKPSECACANLKDSLWEYCDPSLNTNFYNDSAFNAQIRLKARSQVVYTVYDDAFIRLDTMRGMSPQNNLRSRIGANMYYLNCSPGLPGMGYEHATHYSYDEAGNVKTLTQDFPQLEGMKQRYKRIDYEYDLLSGKVNNISYNRGFPDQFYQRYSYDADNRLTKAETSRDGFIWKRDAEYNYYQHGPLARASLGDQRVQGVDYAYTLQGWLKAINGDAIDTLIDMGGDGRRSTITPKDAYATVIDYFPNDYKPIGKTPLSRIPASTKGLYNGNIARQTTDVAKFGALVTAYTYDQMNRIRKAGYAPFSGSSAGTPLAFNNKYASAYKYDLDGNIRGITRREGTGTLMDTLVYEYPNAKNNKLTNVLDYAGFSATGVEDLKNFTTKGMSRMLYDADGNVVKDLSSGTDTLKWNIYGKATDLQNKTTKLDLNFGYDALGHRTYKTRTISTDTGKTYLSTYYVREASGNILAEYEAIRQYDNRGAIKAYPPVRSALTGFTATAVKYKWVMALYDLGYLQRPEFETTIMSAAGSSSAMATGYYLAADPALSQQFVMGSPAVMSAMAQYGKEEARYPLADALRQSLAGGDAQAILMDMNMALLGNPDPDAQTHTLVQIAQNLPDLYAQIASDNQIVVNTSLDSAQLFNAMKNIAISNPGYFAGRMFDYYQQDATALDNWLNAVSADSAYYAAPWYQQSGFVTNMQNTLLQSADPAAIEEAGRMGDDVANKHLYGFYGFASWWPAGKTLLSSLNPHLEEVAYRHDPVAYLNGLSNYDLMDSALANVRDADVVAIAGRLGLDYQIIAGDATSMWDAPALKRQSIGLASHHMYGSSRLGIAKYRNQQYRHSWDYITGIIDTGRLGIASPWYSHAYSGVIDTNKLEPWGNGLSKTMVAQHLLGQKQYELTNHLGNVQATLSDKHYVKTLPLPGGAGGGSRDYFNASIVAAYDYYPYGQLMPGRFGSDTAAHCTTTTITQLVPKKTVTPIAISTPGVTLIHGATSIGAPGSLFTGSVIYGKGGGFTKTLSVVPGISIDISLSIPYIYTGATVTMGVYERKAGTIVYLGSKTIGTPFSYTLTVRPTTSSITLNVEVMTSFITAPPTGLFSVATAGAETIVYEPQNVLVNLCNDATDKYEFGFNTQMKVNEVAGVGNWNTAEFWEYGTQTGGRKNRDPVIKPWESPYCTFSGNPISNSDVNGDDAISINRTNTTYTQSNGSAGGSTSLNVNIVKCSGEDTYTYTCTNEKLSNGKIERTTTSEQLHPERGTNDQTNFGTGKNIYLDGLITTTRKMYDYEAIGSLMNNNKTFNDYMVGRNPNAKMWSDLTIANQAMAMYLPVVTYSAFGSFASLGKGVGAVTTEQKSIVIGEGMYRVKPAAQSVGAKWYQAWSKNFPVGRQMTTTELEAAKARNARWINTKINQSYKIYDIGPKGKEITSPFYQLERDMINKANYPTTPLTGF